MIFEPKKFRLRLHKSAIWTKTEKKNSSSVKRELRRRKRQIDLKSRPESCKSKSTLKDKPHRPRFFRCSTK
jgi:hypothetical protein